MRANYFIDDCPATYSECLEYFELNSGFSRDDAKRVFNENNTPESCDYLTEECSEIKIVYSE